MTRLLVIFAAPLLIAPSAAYGATLVTAPYARPGAFTGVDLHADGPFTVLAGSAVTRGGAAGPVRVPVLVPTAGTPITVDGETLATPVTLDRGQRLVVDAAGDAAAAGALAAVLFDGDEVVVVTADARGPAEAMGGADLVVFPDAPPADARDVLLAAGVSVATRGAADKWEQVGEFAVLRAVEPSVRPAAVMPDAYAAVAGWEPGRSPALRTAVGAGAAAFALVVIVAVVALRRRPRAQLGVVLATSCVAAALAVAARLAEPATAVLQGEVVLVDAGRAVAHRWAFFAATAGEAAVVTVPAVPGTVTLPVAYSAAHLTEMAPVLDVDAAGRPVRWTITVAPGRPAAVVQVAPVAPRGATSGDTSGLPLSRLLRPLYQRWPWQVTGPDAAGAVVVERR